MALLDWMPYRLGQGVGCRVWSVVLQMRTAIYSASLPSQGRVREGSLRGLRRGLSPDII